MEERSPRPPNPSAGYPPLSCGGGQPLAAQPPSAELPLSSIHPPTPLLLLSPAPPLRGPSEEEEGEAKLLRAGPECGSVGQAGRPG